MTAGENSGSDGTSGGAAGPPDDERSRDLPLVDPSELEPDDGTAGATGIGGDDPDAPAVAGVLLAAGQGRRFGGANKLLAELDGEPVVVHAARSLLSAGLPVVAVLGYDAARVGGHLLSLDHGGRLALVGNPDYADGQASSVRRGVRAVWRTDAAVFALGDMPRVDPGTVERLVAAFRADAGDALAAAYRGRRGNPVLFGATHFSALAAVSGDHGGRSVLLGGDRSALVETGDPGVRRDVDTPADLERL